MLLPFDWDLSPHLGAQPSTLRITPWLQTDKYSGNWSTLKNCTHIGVQKSTSDQNKLISCHFLQMLWKARSSQRSQVAATQYSWHYTKLAILPTLINFLNLMGIFPETLIQPLPPELSVSALTSSASPIPFSVSNSWLAGTASHSSRHSPHSGYNIFVLLPLAKRGEDLCNSLFNIRWGCYSKHLHDAALK